MNQTHVYIFPTPIRFGLDVIAPIPVDGDFLENLLVRFVFSEVQPINILDYISRFELVIGGQIVERFYGETLKIMNEFQVPAGKRPGLLNLITNSREFYIWVPISFRVNMLSTPELRMVLADYHDHLSTVQLVTEFTYYDQIPTQPISVECTFWQRLEFSLTAGTRSLNVYTQFTNSIKELFWTFEDQDVVDTIDLWVDQDNIVTTDVGTGLFYSVIQPLVNHTRVPDIPIYSYAFAMRPESVQPSGALKPVFPQQHLIKFKEALGTDIKFRVYALTSLPLTMHIDGSVQFIDSVQESGFISTN